MIYDADEEQTKNNFFNCFKKETKKVIE